MFDGRRATRVGDLIIHALVGYIFDETTAVVVHPRWRSIHAHMGVMSRRDAIACSRTKAQGSNGDARPIRDAAGRPLYKPTCSGADHPHSGGRRKSQGSTVPAVGSSATNAVALCVRRLVEASGQRRFIRVGPGTETSGT